MKGTDLGYHPSDWELTKRLLGYMRPFKGIFVGIVLTAFGRHGVYALVVPLIIMLIIDYILLPVPGGDHWFLMLLGGLTGVQSREGTLALLCLLIVVLAVVRGFFHVAHITLRATLSQRILRVMRRDFYRALIHKSFSYLDRVMSGQIISRVTSDMGAIDLFYSETVREVFRHGMQLLFTLYVLYSVDPELTLLCSLPLPAIFLFTTLYSGRVSGYLSRAKSQFGDLSGILVEGIVGHKLIATHGREDHIMDRFRAENQAYVETSLGASLVQSLYRPSSAAMVAVGLALVIFVGGQHVASGTLTVGEMVLFGIYFTQLVGPVRMFARLVMFYQDALASARRVFEVMDVGEDVPEAPDAVELTDVRGEVAFEGVSFSYGDRETISGVSLRVEPGEKVALVGYVGSGKTTLAELVPRFYDVTGGRVTLDGVDVRDVKLSSLRRSVGMVLQDVYVFSDTIRNNIAFGKPDASDEEVEVAARAAQIHEYIASLPDSYGTVVGERGVTLSGGQRQRLTIARALLTDPRVLILDDSTSNVDAETETLIRRAIDELLRGRTAIIITQRASTCEAADKVVVMEGGRVAASGTHRQLLLSSPQYRRLIESQAFTMEADGDG